MKYASEKGVLVIKGPKFWEAMQPAMRVEAHFLRSHDDAQLTDDKLEELKERIATSEMFQRMYHRSKANLKRIESGPSDSSAAAGGGGGGIDPSDADPAT